jgi:hypothetical protein
MGVQIPVHSCTAESAYLLLVHLIKICMLCCDSRRVDEAVDLIHQINAPKKFQEYFG